MMLRRFVCACLAVLVTAFAAADMDPKKDFVLTGTEAIGVLPPEVVSGGLVREAIWSADGAYLAVVRENDHVTPSTVQAMLAGRNETAPPEYSLIIWNQASQQGRSVWTVKATSGSIGEIKWLPGSSSLLLTTQSWQVDKGQEAAGFESHIILVSGASGQAKELARAGDNEFVFSEVSPSRPVALIGHQVFPANPGDPMFTEYRLVHADGSGSATLKDATAKQRQHLVNWSADGGEAYLGAITQSPNPPGRKIVWRSFDFAAGTLKLLAQPSLYRDVEPKLGLLHPSESDSKLTLSPVSRDVQSLWLSSGEKSDFQHCLLCADASSGQLSPSQDAVFYVSQGIGYVRSFVRMTKDQFDKALAAASRSELMHKSKQAALALIMYSADNDDKFPLKEGDLLGTLYPYLKDGEILRGFVYTFPGGDITKVDRPADTEIGYVLGPGGRAIAYMDGHVVWKNDK